MSEQNLQGKPLPTASGGQQGGSPAGIPGQAMTPAPADASRRPRPAVEPVLTPAAFRSGNPEERLRDLLAFAFAAEEGRPSGVEGVDLLRRKADGELSAYAVRHLHNRIEEIRREAQKEALSGGPRPPGFLKLVLAALTAFLIGNALLFYAIWHFGGLD